jgi:hypothetical protein
MMRAPHRTTNSAGAAIGTALVVILATAAPASPASTAGGVAPRVETRLLPATAAWSVPVEILESGAVVGNDAAAGTFYGDDEVSLDGDVRPWVWTGRARRDLDLAGRPTGTVIDVAETGVAVGSLSQLTDAGTRSLAVRWNAAGTPSVLLPDVAGDTAAQDVNLRGDALVDAYLPDQAAFSQVELVTAADGRRTIAPNVLTYAKSLNTRREVLYTTYGAGGALGSGYWRDGVATPLPAGSFREPMCLSELTETGFVAWRNRTFQGGVGGVLRAADGTERLLPVAADRVVDIGCRSGGQAGEDVVSERGHVVGTTYPDIDHFPGPSRAVLWRGAGLPVELGALGPDTDSAAVAVNERDHVLAHSIAAGQQWPVVRRPFLWRAGQALELPVPAGFDRVIGIDLNNRGQVLGIAVRDGEGVPAQVRAVVWTVR